MRFCFLLLLLVSIFSAAQNSSLNIDSLTRIVDSNREVLRQTDKKLNQWQDSIDRQKLVNSLQQNNRSLDRFLADMKERERADRRQLYVRIGAGTVFLAALLIGFIRKRKTQKKDD